MSEKRMVQGWKYKLKNTRDEVFSGIFDGYAVIGSDTTVILDTDIGIVYVPTGKIACMMLIEQNAMRPGKNEYPDVYHG